MQTPRLSRGMAGGTAPPNRWLSGFPESSCRTPVHRGVSGPDPHAGNQLDAFQPVPVPDLIIVKNRMCEVIVSCVLALH